MREGRGRRRERGERRREREHRERKEKEGVRRRDGKENPCLSKVDGSN
jgi:hypothetical protein